MSFHQNQNRKAKCPLYDSVVKTSNNKVTGIVCLCMDTGNGETIIVKRHGFNDLMRFKRQHCDSMEGYKDCYFYRRHQNGK